MSNTLTVTKHATHHSSGIQNDVLLIHERKTGIQGSSDVTLERSTFRPSGEASGEHMLEDLCPHYRRCLVKQPPHATHAISYRVPIEPQATYRPNEPNARVSNVTEECVMFEFNRARSKPQEYLVELRARRREVVGSTLWSASGAMRLTEGTPALEEAIADLEAYASGAVRAPLAQMSDGLCLAAQDLALDVGPKGLVTQRGTDESTVRERAERYGVWVDRVAEIAIFGVKDAVDIITYILINDGVRSRIHRKLLLDPTLAVVGCCVAPHSTASCVAVIVLAGEFVNKPTGELVRARELVTTLAPPLPTCSYCLGALELKRCVYGLGGRPFHKNCCLCKVCKSTLRHCYFEVEYNGSIEALCKDCLMFRRCPRCSACGDKITFALEVYRKNSKLPLCESCFLLETRQLTEGYSHDDGRGLLRGTPAAAPPKSDEAESS